MYRHPKPRWRRPFQFLLKRLVTLKTYKCAYATPHLHKISNLTKIIVSIGQFTFDYKVLKRYMIRKIVKQGIIWFSNMQIRYFKDLCEPCLNAPKSFECWHLCNRTVKHCMRHLSFFLCRGEVNFEGGTDKKQI